MPIAPVTNSTYQRRVLAWFSCGDASAVASKLAVEKYGAACEVVYCDTSAHEHPDNKRFLLDVQRWLGVEIKVIRSADYTDIYDVFERTGWLIGPAGARCTTEMKKIPRMTYQRPDDLHIFGLTVEEYGRITTFMRNNPELECEFILADSGIGKSECHRRVRAAGIELPAMYKLGYRNNNCIGCVKGGLGYWNKIRVDFPDYFDKMAALERRLDVAINKTETREGGKRIRKRVFLDELPPTLGNYKAEPDIECGIVCQGLPKIEPTDA